MVDRPKGGEKAVLVHVYFPVEKMQEDLVEFEELARSAGADPVAVVTGKRVAPDAKYFVGSGKILDIQNALQSQNAELVIFNHALSPAQERNLERFLKCRVVDRTGLILDIFAQRARSFEGKLQVELALLKHISTRLIRGWTHLERQRGGIGLRGPGETQLEVDRRLIKKRIQFITQRLNRVKQQRDQSRKARHKAEIPTVALVGYTNAGKSTLFNRLTHADVYVANRLFATLDPTLRRIDLSEFHPIILADTVGFIRHLPHDLVEAFHATLQEVAEADLLLHIVDAYDENKQANIAQVNHVLKSIHADEVPQVLVYNKIDLCPDLPAGVRRDDQNKIKRIFISAQNEIGLSDLTQALTEILQKEIIECCVMLKPSDAQFRAQLYRMQAVVKEEVDEFGNYHIHIKMPLIRWEMLQKLFL